MSSICPRPGIIWIDWLVPNAWEDEENFLEEEKDEEEDISILDEDVSILDEDIAIWDEDIWADDSILDEDIILDPWDICCDKLDEDDDWAAWNPPWIGVTFKALLGGVSHLCTMSAMAMVGVAEPGVGVSANVTILWLRPRPSDEHGLSTLYSSRES